MRPRDLRAPRTRRGLDVGPTGALAFAWLEFHTASAFAGALAERTKDVGPFPLPAAIASIVLAEATDRSCCIISSTSLEEPACPSRCLINNQLLRALALAIALHPHQDPRALQPIAIQRKFQFSLFKLRFWINGAFRSPVSAVPQLHRAAAILTFRNRAFEVSVVERMILHLDRQSLVLGIDRGSASDRPGLEHAAQLESEVPVQPPGGVFLNDVTQACRTRYTAPTAGFRSLRKIPLRSVGCELSSGHGDLARTESRPV